MSPTHFNVDIPTHAEVRDRIADHLGFLLAKQWIRRHTSSGGENRRLHCPCAEKPEHPDVVEQSTRRT